MGYRKDAFAPGRIYHIYNRGVEKRDVFLSNSDRIRFRVLFLHCLSQGPVPSYSLLKKAEKRPKPGTKRLADLLCYCLMPNHFHILLKENVAGGISKYMQRLVNSYVRYFNTKYKRIGPLFAGPFRSVLVAGDDQFLHLTRYIHLNPYVARLTNDPFDYEWSSLAEYTGIAKYKFCRTQTLSQIMSPNKYRSFLTDYADYARELADIKHLLHDQE